MTLSNEDASWNKQSVIGRLFGADNRPKHYWCTSNFVILLCRQMSRFCSHSSALSLMKIMLMIVPMMMGRNVMMMMMKLRVMQSCGGSGTWLSFSKSSASSHRRLRHRTETASSRFLLCSTLTNHKPVPCVTDQSQVRTLCHWPIISL